MKTKVLLKVNYEDEWEHIVVFDKSNNKVLSDGVEDHHLSAYDVLSELGRLGIIEFESEEITE